MDKIVTGSASELIACAYFLREGYYVFRSVHVSCPFDLIIHKDDISYRVEVKTLTVVDGKSSAFSAPRNSQWDLLAVVNINDSKTHVFESRYSIETIRKELAGIYTPGNTPQIMPCNKRVTYIKKHLEDCEMCKKIATSAGIWEAVEAMNNSGSSLHMKKGV